MELDSLCLAKRAKIRRHTYFRQVVACKRVEIVNMQVSRVSQRPFTSARPAAARSLRLTVVAVKPTKVRHWDYNL